MLEVVVTHGTATAGKLDGYTAAGKTGTETKLDETGRYSKTKFVASFAGFAPASNPVIAIIVVIDGPAGPHMGGQVAAPLFKKVAEPILRYMSVPPDVPSYAPQYTVKNEKKEFQGRTPNSDLPAIRGASLEFAGFSPRSDDTPDLGGITIPDFHGKSLR